MAEVDRFKLPEVNIDTLLEKLTYILSQRSNGEYENDVVESSKLLLSAYWTAKNSVDDPEGDTFFKHLHVIWNVHKPEVLAIILEDMIANGNSKTEKYLSERDEDIRSKINSEKLEADLVKSGRIIKHKTMFSGEMSPVKHYFRLEDLELIKDYIYTLTLKKYGLTEIDGYVFKGDLDTLYEKYVKATKSKNYGKLLSYIRCAQYIEAYIINEMDCKLSTPQETIERIKESLDNDKYLSTEELADIVVEKIPISDVPKVSAYIEKITGAYNKVKDKCSRLKDRYVRLKTTSKKRNKISSVHSRVTMAEVYRIYELLSPDEKDNIPGSFIDTLVYYGDFDSVKPFHSKKEALKYNLSDKAWYLIMYMCTCNR